MNKESHEETYNRLLAEIQQQFNNNFPLQSWLDMRSKRYEEDPVGAMIKDMKDYINGCGFSFCHLLKCLTNKYVDHYTADFDDDGHLVLNIYIAEDYEIRSEPTENWHNIIINLYGGK